MRLAYTLFNRVPDLLVAEPSDLTPREVSAALLDLRAAVSEARQHVTSTVTPSVDDRAELRGLAQQLMRDISTLLRRHKVKDILVVDFDDDWPLVRKRRAPLSDWDIWHLHTALTMLRRTHAMVTDAERYALTHPDFERHHAPRPMRLQSRHDNASGPLFSWQVRS